MATLEFAVDNTALETVKELEIKTNYDEFKKELTEFCKPYANMVVTADDIANAKTDRAKLRKIEKSIDDYRKKVKSVYSEPIKVFEDKCKELVAICVKASGNIDEQVKVIESIARETKLGELESYFYKQENAYPSIITFEKILNPKWGNTTYSIEQCYNDINHAISTAQSEIEMIIAMQFEEEKSVLMAYSDKLDFKAAVTYGNQLRKLNAIPNETDIDSLPAGTYKAPEVKADKKQKFVQSYQLTVFLDDTNVKEITDLLENNGIRYTMKKL